MTKALLSDMVADLRAEVGHSLMLGHGTNMEDTLKYYLRRTQRELYVGFDWPQFMIDEKVSLNAGDRYITSLTNLEPEQVNTMYCSVGSVWEPMYYGIDPEHYSLYNSDIDARGFPVARYAYDDIAGNLEVWPIPSVDANLLVKGQRTLPPLTDNAHQSLLDGQLIVLYAAANILARQKTEDASLVLNKAQQYLVSLQKQNGSQKRTTRSMAAYASGGRRPRPGLDYIPPKPGP